MMGNGMMPNEERMSLLVFPWLSSSLVPHCWDIVGPRQRNCARWDRKVIWGRKGPHVSLNSFSSLSFPQQTGVRCCPLELECIALLF